MSLSRTIKIILKLQGRFVGRTLGDLLDPKGRWGSRPYGEGPQGLGQSFSPAIQLQGLLSWLLSANLQAHFRECGFSSKPLQESKYGNRASHMNFLVSSTYKNCVYTTLWPIKCAIRLCLEKQCTCCNLKILY